MEINILDYRLKVMSFKKAAISKYTHALLNILFLRNTRLKDRSYSFVSVTETDLDYSIVCDEDCLPLLEECKGELTVVDGVWLPLVVSVGLEGLTTIGISKIARSVIIPLADFEISVYCLSTYKTDYVLVKESDLPYACSVLAYDFKITEEKSITSEEVKIDPSTIPSREVGGPLRPITHTYTSPGNTFYITSMDRSSVEAHALSLIDCLFFPHPQPQGYESFFSLGIVDHDISLVLDEHLLHKFPPYILFNTQEKWKMVKIGDMPGGLGFVTAGIVAQMSDPIASAQISEYYISSYYYGHTLVPYDEIGNVMQLLSERKAVSLQSACAEPSYNQMEDFGDSKHRIVVRSDEEISE